MTDCDSKITWKYINSLLNRNKKKINENIVMLNRDNAKKRDPKDVSDILNEHFVNVSNSLKD